MSTIEEKIARLDRGLKKLVTYPIKRAISAIYAPKNLLSGVHEDVKVHEVRIDDRPYQVVNVRNGRIFTDRSGNVSVMSRRSLVPAVSWQYNPDGAAALPDIENHLLTQKLLLDRFPWRIQGTVVSLLTGGGANNNYFHWLYDALPRLYIAKTILNLDENTQYLIPEETYSFQKETLDLLGIPVGARISSKECQHLRATNTIATSHPNLDEGAPEWVVKFLRESLGGGVANTIAERLIYISRGDSKRGRRLLNEDYLRTLLESVGFSTYRLSELTVSQQISLFSQAKMIVGTHGAGFSNLAFASRGAIVYELFSDRYQPDLDGKANPKDKADMYERVSRIVGLEYHRIVCSAVRGDNSNWLENNIADFHISERDSIAILKHAERITTGHT
ncbi:glycosyltransferase family 61 protein [Chamaesiphon sp. OTE_8_metabat_110]|uniref:glycosyltransferase family 61 protein n=1 Tax=Chamaesiphon sp. OTE_8_metabat_110 TaxID=2964696 RepID=UPI00286B8014|nr:glycosyltransferase family 61 protein [Chamaesiphon sp. OTE_8_metabat_110]